MTGERRSATVIANKDCEVVEIGKEILANSLKENPDLVNKLSDLLALRQMENEGLIASIAHIGEATDRQSEYQTTFVSKLKRFFEL